MKKSALFYDANCFTTISVEDLKYAIDFFDNYIISSVKAEIHKGKESHPDHPGFNLVLNSDGNLTKAFNEVNLDYCDKNPNINIEKTPFSLKESPLLCSAYYTWLVSAINPAIIHDSYRHSYNELLYQLKNEPQEIKEIYGIESKLRVTESQRDEIYYKQAGRNPIIKPHWILKSRKKRMDEIKDNKFKITDYQNLTAAFIYSCTRGGSTSILTSDRDFLDLRDNLYRSIIERYATNQILTEKVQNFNSAELEEYNKNSIDINLKFDDINNRVLLILKKIMKDRKFFTFNILLYKREVNKIFTYENKIPLWLRDFILEYKKGLDCYSIETGLEMKYKIKYIFQPDFSTQTIIYRVSPRKLHENKVFMIDCEMYCKYALKERDNPMDLSEFILKF